MEYVSVLSFSLLLSNGDVIVTQKSSNGYESNISLGGDIILLALVARKLCFVGKKTFWVDPSPQPVIL